MTKKDEREKGAFIDSGVVFSGLLEGLGSFMETVSQAIDEDGKEFSRSGEFTLDKANRLDGLYGLSVRVNDRGLPSVKRFGTVPGSDVREPIVDVFDEETSIRIITEMPGVDEENISFTVDGTQLGITAEQGDRKYAAEITLPALVKDSGVLTCRAGLAEIVFEKVQPDTSE